jgi:protein-S-isoprenylcysteine O-methyltransferase Ste14
MIFAFGVYLAIWARLVLGANWGMPMTQKQDPQLVTSGIYGYIRHPIYSGVLLMSLGSFLAVNYYWSLVFIVAAIYFVYSARVEERLMKKQFPTAYPAYMKRAKMLIPFIF